MARRARGRAPLRRLDAYGPAVAGGGHAIAEHRRGAALPVVCVRELARGAGTGVSVRLKNGRPIIEVYDPRTARKRYVTHAEIRALGFAVPTSLRQARK